MSLPYFPLYPTDYKADTAHLTNSQIGVYFRMIMECWASPNCTIPNDVEWILDRIMSRKDDENEIRNDVEVVIEQFFKKKKGRIYQKKLLEIHKTQNAKHKSHVNAGKKGARVKALKNNNSNSRVAKGRLKQPEPEPKPNIPPNPQEGQALAAGFNQFFDLIPNAKRGSKDRAFRQWGKLEDADRAAAIDCAADYFSGADTVQAAQYLRARKFDGVKVHVPPADPIAKLVYDAIADPMGFDTWFAGAEFRDGVIIQSSPTRLNETVKKYGPSLEGIGFEIVAEAA